MERLWSPWRMEYIHSTSEEDQEGCIFCELPESGDDQAALILGRGHKGFVLLNKFPYNSGHLMVAPYRHTGEVEWLEDDEVLDTGHLLQRAIRALREVMSPQGFNVGMNLGRVAGAGIPDHVHWHVVPRWGGDTNFMPVLGQTKVLPELLRETWERLRPHFV